MNENAINHIMSCLLFSCGKGECVDCQIEFTLANVNSASKEKHFCENAFESSQDYNSQKSWYLDNGYTCTEQ